MTNPLFPTHEDASAQSKRMMVDEVFEAGGFMNGGIVAGSVGAHLGGFVARKAGRIEGMAIAVRVAPAADTVVVRLTDGATNIDLTIPTGATTLFNGALSQAITAGSHWYFVLQGGSLTAEDLSISAWGTYTR